METELIRTLMVLGVLAANSYSDVRRRTLIGGDRHYALAGGAGLALFLLGCGWTDAAAVLGMAAGVTLALVLHRCRAVASGDCIIILVFSVTLPAALGVPFLPVLAGLLGITILSFAVVAYNVTLNVSHAAGLYRHPAAGPRPFSAYGTAGTLKKAAGFFTAHHQRVWETHVVPVDDQHGGFSLRTTLGRRKWKRGVKAGRPVMVAAPVIPFLLAALILLLSLPLLSV